MSEILFEYAQSGNFMKVTAIEPQTQTEACVIVPTSLTKEQMQLQALNKLRYVLKKLEES